MIIIIIIICEQRYIKNSAIVVIIELVQAAINTKRCEIRNRIVAIWNSLPNTVISADSTNTFKNRSDKFWANQDSKYVRNADINGIGSRSINSLSIYMK